MKSVFSISDGLGGKEAGISHTWESGVENGKGWATWLTKATSTWRQHFLAAVDFSPHGENGARVLYVLFIYRLLIIGNFHKIQRTLSDEKRLATVLK